MEIKHKYRFFALPDFIEEQEFLMEQHSQGWKFVNYNGFNKYTFEKCNPENYTYQLDYKEDDTDDESYIQLFNDYGWEYLMKYNRFYYFRKENTNSDIDISIFSNKESKLQMIKAILNKQNKLFISILPILIFFSYLLIKTSIDDGNIAFIIFTCIIIGIYIFSLFLHLRNLFKLQRLIRSIE
ncbi:MAG: DUF2812 domain-containing protein [Coprobacillaceae bacterium]